MGGQIAFVNDSIGKNAQGVADAIAALGQAEAMRRDYLLSKQINKAIAQGIDLPQIGSMAANFQAPKASGVMGGLQGFGQSFAPPSQIPGQITQMQLQGMTPEAKLKRQQIESDIAATKARQTMYENRPATQNYVLAIDPDTKEEMLIRPDQLESLDPRFKQFRKLGVLQEAKPLAPETAANVTAKTEQVKTQTGTIVPESQSKIGLQGSQTKLAESKISGLNKLQDQERQNYQDRIDAGEELTPQEMTRYEILMKYRTPETTLKPGELVSQEKLDEIKQLKEERTAGTITPERSAQLDKMLAPGGTTVNIGEKAAPTTERKEFTDLLNFSATLDDINKTFEEGDVQRFIGPAAGRLQGIDEAWTTWWTTPEATTYRQQIGNIGDVLLRLRSGAAINEQEFKRLWSLLPTYNMPLQTFKARLNGIREATKQLLEIKREGLQVSGLKVPEKSEKVKSSNTTIANPAKVKMKDPDGQEYMVDPKDVEESKKHLWEVVP